MAHGLATTLGIGAVIYGISTIVFLFTSNFNHAHKHVVALFCMTTLVVGTAVYTAEYNGYGRDLRNDGNVVYTAHYYFEALQYGAFALALALCKGWDFGEALSTGMASAAWGILHALAATAHSGIERFWFFFFGLVLWAIVAYVLLQTKARDPSARVLFGRAGTLLYIASSGLLAVGFVVTQFGYGWIEVLGTAIWVLVADVIVVISLVCYIRNCTEACFVAMCSANPPHHSAPYHSQSTPVTTSTSVAYAQSTHAYELYTDNPTLTGEYAVSASSTSVKRTAGYV